MIENRHEEEQECLSKNLLKCGPNGFQIDRHVSRFKIKKTSLALYIFSHLKHSQNRMKMAGEKLSRGVALRAACT